MPIKNRSKFYGSPHLSMNSIMTKQQKLRRTGFAADFNAGDDDFILADLDLMRDDEELPPVPLNRFTDDDEIIDSLLIHTGFNANKEQEEDDKKLDADMNRTDDDSDFDRFIVEAVELKGQHEQSPVSEVYVAADFDDMPDADAIDKLLINAGFDGYDEQEPDAPVIDDISPVDKFEITSADTVADKSDLAAKKNAGILMEQEERPETVKQPSSPGETTVEIKPELAADKLNNPAITGLLPLGSEQEAIKKLINDCEVKVKKAAVISYASMALGLAALLAMVAVVVMVFSAQTKISKLSDLVTILEEDMGGISGKNADLVIDNSDLSAEHLNNKVSARHDRSDERAQHFADTSKKKITAVAAKPTTVNRDNDKPPTKTMHEKQKSSKAAVKKRSAEKKLNYFHPAAWSVNLDGYKDRSSAQNKAAVLVKKGVPVKVVVDAKNNITRYRLRVGGFKNKAEAVSYSAKIKKSLNLNSVAVGNT